MRLNKTLMLVAVLEAGFCIYLAIDRIQLSRTAESVKSQLLVEQQKRQELEQRILRNQDSVAVFDGEYRSRLERVKKSLDAYSSDRSEANKRQLQNEVVEFAEFVHAWQELISAMVPMFDPAILQIVAAGNAGDVSRTGELIAKLEGISALGSPALQKKIGSLNSLQASTDAKSANPPGAR